MSIRAPGVGCRGAVSAAVKTPPPRGGHLNPCGVGHVDVVISASALGLVGGLVLFFTLLGRIPPWLGYPLGGALLSIYVLIVVVGLKSSREFKRRPPPSASVVGRRGVVVEVEGGWALVKLEGAYWKVYCGSCAPGDVVEVVEIGDVGVVARRVE